MKDLHRDSFQQSLKSFMFIRCFILLLLAFVFWGLVLDTCASLAETTNGSHQTQTSVDSGIGETDFFSTSDPQWSALDNPQQHNLFGQSDPSASESNDFLLQDISSPTASSGRPRGIPIGLQAEWISDSDVRLSTYGTSIKIPLLFISKSPPPIAKIGFAYTDFSAPVSLEFLKIFTSIMPDCRGLKGLISVGSYERCWVWISRPTIRTPRAMRGVLREECLRFANPPPK